MTKRLFGYAMPKQEEIEKAAIMNAPAGFWLVVGSGYGTPIINRRQRGTFMAFSNT